MHLTHKQKKEMRYWQWKLTSLAGTKAKLFSTCAFKKPNFYVWNALFWSQHTSTQKFKTQVYEQMPHKISKKYICLLKKTYVGPKTNKIWSNISKTESLIESLHASFTASFTESVKAFSANFHCNYWKFQCKLSVSIFFSLYYLN